MRLGGELYALRQVPCRTVPSLSAETARRPSTLAATEYTRILPPGQGSQQGATRTGEASCQGAEPGPCRPAADTLHQVAQLRIVLAGKPPG
jgi:hypothetical protein